MEKKFQRKIEDFVCENCSNQVNGDGFTNHCPKCLWSKHVDVTPGDRRETCLGMMEPVRLAHRRDQFVITHRCQKCGYEKDNKAAVNDNLAVILG